MTDREHLTSLVEAVEAMLAGGGQEALVRMRTATARARIALDHCPSDAEVASRVGYAAGAASAAMPHSSPPG